MTLYVRSPAAFLEDSMLCPPLLPRLLAHKGEYVTVRVGDRAWLVQRHYLALHGIEARDLPGLGFEEVTKPEDAL